MASQRINSTSSTTTLKLLQSLSRGLALKLLVTLIPTPVSAGGFFYESPFQWDIGWEIGISADGSAIVGTTHLWMPSENRAIELPEDFVAQGGITANGEVLTGTVYGASWEPSLWSESDGLVQIDGISNAAAFDISDDGSTIAGSSGGFPPRAYRRGNSGGVSLIPLPSGFTAAHGDMISGDGKVVVGFGWGQFTGWRAYRWSEDAGAHDLGVLGEKEWYRAKDLSQDGSVVVGYGWDKDEVTRENVAYEAYRWTHDQQMVGLGTLPGRAQSTAAVVSEDGQLVLGTTFAAATSSATSLNSLAEELFIWSEDLGMQSLTDILSNELGTQLPSNLLVRAMSADERTIVGYARDLTNEFDQQLWAVVLDRPIRDLLNAGDVGDFNGDGIVNVSDVDLLSEAIRQFSQDRRFDLDASSIVDIDDLVVLVQDELKTFLGDANLDRKVDFDDFLSLSSSFGGAGSWAVGDFNADGQVQFDDFLALSSNFGRVTSTGSAVASVPEPTGGVVVTTACLAGWLHRRRQRSRREQRANQKAQSAI